MDMQLVLTARAPWIDGEAYGIAGQRFADEPLDLRTRLPGRIEIVRCAPIEKFRALDT